MNARFLLGASCGAVFAVVTILACGDDSPTPADADAGSCECPAAEPPLAGRIVRVKGTPAQIRANEFSLASTGCPEGGIALGGSCTLSETSGIEQVRLIQGGHAVEESPNAWVCTWFNGSTAPVTGVAAVNCLVPTAQ
jgi:hypothetical protein